MQTRLPNEYQTAVTLLAGFISRPSNQQPLERLHHEIAAEWAADLGKYCKGDPHLMAASARLIVGFMQNPLSAHCSKDEFLRYGITSALALHKQVHEPAPPPPSFSTGGPPGYHSAIPTAVPSRVPGAVEVPPAPPPYLTPTGQPSDRPFVPTEIPDIPEAP